MTTKRKAFLAAGMMALTLGDSEIIAAPASGEVPYRYAVANASDQPQYEQVVTRRRYYRGRYVVKRRSKAKSAAIVGGSAAGGAAIGALAGGGKGAAIGALAGGAGGFLLRPEAPTKVVRPNLCARAGTEVFAV